jgi:hypothetical protein
MDQFLMSDYLISNHRKFRLNIKKKGQTSIDFLYSLFSLSNPWANDSTDWSPWSDVSGASKGRLSAAGAKIPDLKDLAGEEAERILPFGLSTTDIFFIKI